ncbi:MAG: DUF3800 domain-containing protein [Nitrosopumilus sp.]|nr:DUF3800 domain-containing protein [Nitrosopumilus sp.]
MIKKKEFPEYDPNEIELHVKDMLKRKKWLQNISREQIHQLLDKTFHFLSKPETDYFIVASLIQKKLMYEPTDIEKLAYQFLLERINNGIKLLNKQNKTSEKCQLYIDTEGRRDQTISGKIKHELEDGEKYSNLELIKLDVYFMRSQYSNMLQITDCIAYAIRRYWRENNNQNRYDQKWNDYYCLIEPKFSKYRGKFIGVGLKIFPEPPFNVMSTNDKNKRQEKGKEISQKGSVFRLSNSFYNVTSQTAEKGL